MQRNHPKRQNEETTINGAGPCLFCPHNDGLEEDKTFTAPNLHGTLRGKYEYQTQENKGRFEVRTARVSIDGSLTQYVDYKAEIDLCDEGQIKMLDAYTRIKPFTGFMFTIGQERVPFTIDAHRSPDKQYFANRSFIAKQWATCATWVPRWPIAFMPAYPSTSEPASSTVRDSPIKDFWTNNINYSAKAEFFIPGGFNVTLSAQKIKPDNVGIYMYDAGAYYHRKGWHIEGEYLYKTYADNAFNDVHAIDAFASYDIPLRSKMLQKVSPPAEIRLHDRP